MVSAVSREPEARAKPLAAEPLEEWVSRMVGAVSREPEARAKSFYDGALGGKRLGARSKCNPM
jgi:hypothetical protein